MDHHPPDDRRITSGAVATAWAMVAGMTALMALASALAPAKQPPFRPMQQAALHAGCAHEDTSDEDPDRSLRE